LQILNILAWEYKVNNYCKYLTAGYGNIRLTTIANTLHPSMGI